MVSHGVIEVDIGDVVVCRTTIHMEEDALEIAMNRDIRHSKAMEGRGPVVGGYTVMGKGLKVIEL